MLEKAHIVIKKKEGHTDFEIYSGVSEVLMQHPNREKKRF